LREIFGFSTGGRAEQLSVEEVEDRVEQLGVEEVEVRVEQLRVEELEVGVLEQLGVEEVLEQLGVEEVWAEQLRVDVDTIGEEDDAEEHDIK
jgi:hypothetical protein